MCMKPPIDAAGHMQRLQRDFCDEAYEGALFVEMSRTREVEAGGTPKKDKNDSMDF